MRNVILETTHAEAKRFDFLEGRWNAICRFPLPDGSWGEGPGSLTVSRVLDGCVFLEEFQENAAIDDPAYRERARSFAPRSLGQRKAADGIPAAFKKIDPLGLGVRGLENHIVHANLLKYSGRRDGPAFHPRVCRDPVDLPGPASVFRKCLLEAA